MLFSIIIAFHSNKNLLDQCVYSLEKTIPKDCEIIIVANNYDSSYISNINYDFKNITILIVNKNLYYSGAMNYGAKYSKGKYLIFSDTDTVYTDNWLNPLFDFYISNSNVGLVSPKLLDPRTDRIQDFGIAFSPFNGPHPFKGLNKNHPLVSKNYSPQAACSACCLIKRETFFQVVGFNELLGYSYADIDLCYKLENINYSTWCIHNSLVYHKGNSVLTPMSSFIKADIKAKFVEINSNYIKYDINKYFQKSFEYFKTYNVIKEKYYLINISSVYDKDYYHDILINELSFEIYDIYYKSTSNRDQNHINLYEILSYNILSLKSPIIYFVDEFISLSNNAMWFNMRNNSNDLIIDRNANIVTVEDLLNEY